MIRRRADYDALRVLSMFGVVYLHTVAVALRGATGALWQFSNLVSSLATAAVPLFFMLSGALLLSGEKTADLSYLFRKRLPKVVVPLVVWSLVVVLVAGLRGDWPGALAKLPPLLNTPVVVPYWFVYALVPMYLISPFLKKMADGMTSTHWNYLMVLWFGLTIGLRTLRLFLPAGVWQSVFTEHWTLNINMIGGYLGYFLLGARLERLEHIPKKPVLWGVTAIGFLVVAGGTLYDFLSTGLYNERFKSYLHLFTAVLATSLFLLFRAYLEGRESGRLMAALSNLSFGIYLAHPLAISFWGMVCRRLWGAPPGGILGQLALYAVILGSCIVGIWVISRIKPLCWLFTGQRYHRRG